MAKQRSTDIIEHQYETEQVIRDVIAEEVPPIVFLSQEEYDVLDPPVEGTLYYIVGAPPG